MVGISLLSAMVITFIIAIFTVPSLNNRLRNTQKDLNHYNEGKELNHYSISMRLESLKTAWKVYKTSPILGVGVADINQEMNAQYEADKSPLMHENRKLPHNQFLQTLTSLGLAGLFSLLLIFIYPFFKPNKYLTGSKFQYLFLAFLVLCFFSFQVESILERQIGVTFFSLFYILLGNSARPENLDTTNPKHFFYYPYMGL